MLEDDVEVGAGGERDGMKEAGVGLADAKSAAADGAGRAEDCDLLHSVYFSPAGVDARGWMLGGQVKEATLGVRVEGGFWGGGSRVRDSLGG